MKTYAEARGYKSFDWNAFLSKDTYTKKDLANAIKEAQSWVTCACGNQCEVIPRDTDGEPSDSELSALGFTFLTDVECLAFAFVESKQLDCFLDKAKETLALIERRSDYLLRELESQNEKRVDL